uniref:Uncharacterized protein n=1 Tax=Fagus sylvatica TaxID=28930 RepID=A0A2N9GGI8_FAGSY
MSPTLQNQNKSKLLVKTGNTQVQREHKYDWDYVETGSNSKFSLRIFANSWRRLPVANSEAAGDFPNAEAGSLEGFWIWEQPLMMEFQENMFGFGIREKTRRVIVDVAEGRESVEGGDFGESEGEGGDGKEASGGVVVIVVVVKT